MRECVCGIERVAVSVRVCDRVYVCVNQDGILFTLSFSVLKATEWTTGSMQDLSARSWNVLRDAWTLDTPAGTSKMSVATVAPRVFNTSKVSADSIPVVRTA